jgi:hypothetical protein
MTPTPNTPNTEAASAAFIFSATQGTNMTFKTHNEITIDSNCTCLQGEVDASYQELCDLFGAPTGGDGYKVDAEWYVKFDDGTIATIYNWKNGKNYEGENGLNVEDIRDWHVGGFTGKAPKRVQIALDLHREKKQEEEDKGDKFKEAFGSAFEMFESIAQTKGVPYARVVELATHIRKKQELMTIMVSGMVSNEHIPEDAGKALMALDSSISAKIISLACDIAQLKIKNKEGAEEIMNWTDRIMEAEQAGAKNLFGDLFKKAEGDD